MAAQKCWSAENTYSTRTHSSLPAANQKQFQYADRTITVADEIRQLPFNVQEEANDVHMIQGIQNNLLSTNQFAKAK